MNNSNEIQTVLPSVHSIRQALEIYLRHAYEGGRPGEAAAALLPPDGDFDPVAWFSGDMVEREPADAPLTQLRSAGFRLGNVFYPNMKLRLSRPPNDPFLLFCVDSHDAILQAPPGTPDHAMLEELKAGNARMADAILADWERAGLPTERNYLRYKILQTKQRKSSQ